jgi:hypothetical protein
MHISEACGMTYRWSPRTGGAQGLLSLKVSTSGDPVFMDDIAIYRRVDVIEPHYEPENQKDAVRLVESHPESTNERDVDNPIELLRTPESRRKAVFIWFCSSCSDGPYGAWQLSCGACGHTKCRSCCLEEPG